MQKIMFSDKFGLTQAVIDGRKTMTRRIINDEDELYNDIRCMKFSHINGDGLAVMRSAVGVARLVPKYKIGEVVAVAQAYGSDDFCKHIPILHGVKIGTEAEGALIGNYNVLKGWNNKMFVRADLMPYRIKITNIRVERLRDISDDDCFKEGILKVKCGNHRHSNLYPFYFEGGRHEFDNSYSTPRQAFAALIDKINGKGTFDRNPWVFVYEFELIKS